MGDHFFVERTIDLDEIQRAKLQFDIPRRQRERQLRRRRIIQHMHRIDALGLQVDGEAFAVAEIA